MEKNEKKKITRNVILYRVVVYDNEYNVVNIFVKTSDELSMFLKLFANKNFYYVIRRKEVEISV